MCGRYVIISTVKEIEKKFNARLEFNLEQNYNVSAGQRAPIITADQPQRIIASHFGFTPSWSDKKTYIINARAEGDHNRENDPKYNGSKGILKKPFFRKAIRSQRCLVIADAFIEGTTKEKLNNPFLVYLRNKERPFAMAGIYDEWEGNNDGEVYSSFAIITCPPNSLMQKLPHHRMPVILPPEDQSQYLSHSTPLSEATALLKPFDSKKMNAYPISAEIKSPKNNNKSLLSPNGTWVKKERELKKTDQLTLFGMGERKQRK
ncbi:MAG: SOS response-associated peptidase [Vicingaceae bacterium]